MKMTTVVPDTRQRLLDAATLLFRRNGFAATSIDDICAAVKVTKGAFFHYFKGKEALAEACLNAWDEMGRRLFEGTDKPAPDADRTAWTLAQLDRLAGFFSQAREIHSCLAGTTLQEVSESHPKLRDASNRALANGAELIQSWLDDACRAARIKRDTRSIAFMWMATLQGSLLLFKGSQDIAIIRESLKHANAYVASQLKPTNR